MASGIGHISLHQLVLYYNGISLRPYRRTMIRPVPHQLGRLIPFHEHHVQPTASTGHFCICSATYTHTNSRHFGLLYLGRPHHQQGAPLSIQETIDILSCWTFVTFTFQRSIADRTVLLDLQAYQDLRLPAIRHQQQRLACPTSVAGSLCWLRRYWKSSFAHLSHLQNLATR